MKDVEEYKPRGYTSVDVNENNVAVLVNGVVFIFETNISKTVLGYYYLPLNPRPYTMPFIVFLLDILSTAFALPLAAGVLYKLGILLVPAAGAVLMSISTIIVAINARLLSL